MGRHREFDADEVLDAAINVFWTRGYEGASISEITAATGVAAPGLYATFGNKQELFMRAMERYETRYLAFMRDALQEPTARAVAKYLLYNNVRVLTMDSERAGCLGLNGALAVAPASEPVREELVRRRRANETALCRRFERARDEGDLPVTLDPEDLARYLMTVSQGMAVQAKAGTDSAQLERLAELAMSVWPAAA